MADNSRIFQEMRDADAIRADMRQGILNRMQDGLGQLYGSTLAQELVSGLQDSYRRLVEQGWFGKDIFDGRFASDRPDGMSNATEQMRQGYSQAQQFYGYDQDRDQGQELGR